MPLNVTQIHRNTAWLFVRCAVRMVADVICVRMVLDALGVESYGAFASLAGLAGVFAFFYGTLHETFMRYLGCVWKSPERSSFLETYSAAGGLTFLYAVSLLIVGEGVGLYFVHHVLVFDSSSMSSVWIAYQLCLGAVVLEALGLPFLACLTAAERMDRIGTAGIVESIVTLLLVTVLPLVPPGARLVAYAGLTACIRGAVTLFYAVSARRVAAVPMRLRLKGAVFADMLHFAGWNVFRSLSNVVRYRGTSVLLNVRAGIAYPAAWSVAMRLGTAIYRFCINFQTAYAPQVFRLWGVSGAGQRLKMVRWTVHRSFALMWFVTFAIFLYAPEILGVWLGKDLPPQAVIFVRIFMLHFALDALNDPLHTSIIACGCERRYQVVVSILQASGFGFAFIALAAGLPAWSAPLSVTAANGLSALFRLYHLRGLVGVGRIRFAASVMGYPLVCAAVPLVAFLLELRTVSAVLLVIGVASLVAMDRLKVSDDELVD